MELSAHVGLIVQLLTQRDSGHDEDTAMLCTQANREQLGALEHSLGISGNKPAGHGTVARVQVCSQLYVFIHLF